MKLANLFEQSLSSMLKQWMLKCQQVLIDADIDVEVRPSREMPLSIYDAEIDFVVDKHLVMTIAQCNDKGRFPSAIVITFPMRQFLQDATDTVEPHIFDQVMQSVINQAPKQ